MKDVFLFTPGPTAVPERVRQAENQPMIHHRSPEFGEIVARVRKRLCDLSGTQGESVLLSSSGSGAMEAAVSSFFKAGEEVIVVESGKFGQRWVKLASHFGLKPIVVSVPWGQVLCVEEVQEALTPQTRGVLVQACESSTGVFHPIAELGTALRTHKDVLYVVDAVSALGVHDMDMALDHIDVLVSGSQKGLMTPPGLGMVMIEPGAMDRLLSESVSFYFSLARELKAQTKNSTGFTPAISLVRALDMALSMIEKEGKAAVFERHQRLKTMTRLAFREMGLELFNRDEDATCGMTVAIAPSELEVGKWLAQLRQDHSLWLAGGQDHLKGKIFRFAHMGSYGVEDVLAGIGLVEKSLSTVLPLAKEGKGLKRAQSFLKEG